MYTSGITGAPKGAALTHANLVANTLHTLATRHHAARRGVPVGHAAVPHRRAQRDHAPPLVGATTILWPSGSFDAAEGRRAGARGATTSAHAVAADLRRPRVRERKLVLRRMGWGGSRPCRRPQGGHVPRASSPLRASSARRR